MAALGLNVMHEPRSPIVTKDVWQETAALVGVQVPERWESDFIELLNEARDLMEELAKMQGAPLSCVIMT